jgi:hypothetical protein
VSLPSPNMLLRQAPAVGWRARCAPPRLALQCKRPVLAHARAARSSVLRGRGAERRSRLSPVEAGNHSAVPEARGLYDPAYDVDSCGERSRPPARGGGGDGGGITFAPAWLNPSTSVPRASHAPAFARRQPVLQRLQLLVFWALAATAACAPPACAAAGVSCAACRRMPPHAGVGFVCELSKQANRAVITDAVKMLVRMTHRGACGCEEASGGCLGCTRLLRARG